MAGGTKRAAGSVSLPAAVVGRSFDEVVVWAGARGVAARKRLVADCTKLARSSRLLGDEATRVGLAMLLVALLPESASTIERQLRHRSGTSAYGLQYTLFCFLEHVAGLSTEARAALDVAALAGDYLGDVPVESAHAVWMAGELLAEHPDLARAAEVLLGAAREARYVAGRLGALHGLGHLFDRVDAAERDRIARVVGIVARHDRSVRVRTHARGVLEGAGYGRGRRAGATRRS